MNAGFDNPLKLRDKLSKALINLRATWDDLNSAGIDIAFFDEKYHPTLGHRSRPDRLSVQGDTFGQIRKHGACTRAELLIKDALEILEAECRRLAAHNRLTPIDPTDNTMTEEQKENAHVFKTWPDALDFVVEYNRKNSGPISAIARNYGGSYYVELLNEAAIPANIERQYITANQVQK
tara:strand:- start:665 stop:1201 length:537 start_codon:yes stop_codon:yes gene_type:complete